MLTGELAGIYLPKALGLLLPGLVDLGKTGGYTFAEYSATENDFRMRTFEVVEPEVISAEGKSQAAMKVTDRPNFNTEPTVLWLNTKGKVLRSKNPNGLVNRVAAREEVLEAFPEAEKVIENMKRVSQD
jgi:hypothetical protein